MFSSVSSGTARRSWRAISAFLNDRTADLQLAVSEAVTNAIEHGNHNQHHVKVGVHFLLHDDRLAIRVVDQGGGMPAFGPLDRPSIDDKLMEESPRGLGIFLIQQLVDEVELQSGEGRTEFTMWFNINDTKRPQELSSIA